MAVEPGDPDGAGAAYLAGSRAARIGPDRDGAKEEAADRLWARLSRSAPCPIGSRSPVRDPLNRHFDPRRMRPGTILCCVISRAGRRGRKRRAIMFGFKKKREMPSAQDALPGRSTAIPTAERHFLNGRPLQGPYPQGSAHALFGMGCFWGSERKFWELGEGIFITAVGYAGGVTPNPTYEEVCSGRTGHNEVVLVIFDPSRISYERLLKTFWENHDPTQGMRQGNDVGTQYRSGIYTFDPAQLKAADAYK